MAGSVSQRIASKGDMTRIDRRPRSQSPSHSQTHSQTHSQKQTRSPTRRLVALGLSLLDLILPSACESCRSPVAWNTGVPSLCPPCRAAVALPTAGHCPLCDSRTPARDWLCASCRLRPPSFDSLHALWLYQPPIDAVLRAFKFSRRSTLAPHLADRLAQRFDYELGTTDAIVPLPLHWRRRWWRGYDQADLLAREVATRAGRPYLAALRRRHATRPQSMLPRAERRLNLKGAFAIRSGMRTVPRCVALIDDVATTGSSLDAASHELKAAGIDQVKAFVLARTPWSRLPPQSRRRLTGNQPLN